MRPFIPLHGKFTWGSRKFVFGLLASGVRGSNKGTIKGSSIRHSPSGRLVLVNVPLGFVFSLPLKDRHTLRHNDFSISSRFLF